MKKEEISKSKKTTKPIINKISDDEMEILSFTSEYKTLKKDLKNSSYIMVLYIHPELLNLLNIALLIV